MADDDRRDDRGFGFPHREHDGRGSPRHFVGDGYGGDPGREGRDGRPGQGDRDGFWGRGHRGSGFDHDDRRDYSREDYGATGRGGSGRADQTAPQGNDRGLFSRAADEVSTWLGDGAAERRREQDFRGRGPKGYQRSDPRIQEDVNDRLADDPYLDASDVEVMVSAAEVTLSGSVDSRRARRRAEDIAEQVSGVRYVQNNIRVRRGGGGATSGTGSMAGESKTA